MLFRIRYCFESDAVWNPILICIRCCLESELPRKERTAFSQEQIAQLEREFRWVGHNILITILENYFRENLFLFSANILHTFIASGFVASWISFGYLVEG